MVSLKRSARTVHLCYNGMLRAAAEKTFVRNRLRITDEFKMNNSVYTTFKEVSFCTLFVQNIGRGPENSLWSHEFEPHFKMNNLVYATFKEVSVCVSRTLFVQNIGRGPENSLCRHEFEPH